MSEWKDYKLSEIMGIIGGGTPKTSFTEYWNGKIPWLSVVDFGGGNKYVDRTEKTITETGLKNSSTKILKKGQIIISARGTVGELAVLKKDMAFNQSCYGLNAIEELCTNDFLYYLMKCQIAELKKNAHGAVFDTITRSTFDTISAKIPPLPTQIAIAEILSSLDDKIELTNAINKNLEDLAQALFKQWFVDFEFLNENGEPYQSSGGEMVESELGMIPKGWKLDKIAKLNVRLESGKRPKGGVKGISEGVPSIGAESIKGIGYFDFAKTKYVSSDFAKGMNKGLITGFELLIYKDGGKPGEFKPNFSMFGEGFPFNEVVINEHVFSLNFNNDYPFNSFSYYYFNSDYVKHYLSSKGGKAAIPGINQSDIYNLNIFPQNIKEVQAFGNIAFQINKQILHNCKENQLTRDLRDTLLPKLISGELSINQAEEMINDTEALITQ